MIEAFVVLMNLTKCLTMQEACYMRYESSTTFLTVLMLKMFCCSVIVV